MRAAIAETLSTRVVGRPLETYDAVTSTNDLVREAARRGAPEGLAVLADAQTAGRGRLGRTWASPPGVNVYLSVLLRPGALPAQAAPQLTLLGGVAVASAALASGLVPTLKWPNDLLLGGRKAAGVLADLETGPGGRIEALVLGMGVNVNLDPSTLPADVAPSATSFAAMLGTPVDRAVVARHLLEAVDAWVGRWRRDGFGPVREAWLALSALAGRRITVALGDPRRPEVVEGIAAGLGDDGSLVLDTPTGRRTVLSGEVTVQKE